MPTTTPTTPDATVQPLGRHIANKWDYVNFSMLGNTTWDMAAFVVLCVQWHREEVSEVANFVSTGT